LGSRYRPDGFLICIRTTSPQTAHYEAEQ
jgi:hypothetical protein